MFWVSFIASFLLLMLLNVGSTRDDQLGVLRSLYPTSNITQLIESYKESPPRKNTKDMYAIESRLRYFFPYDSESEIENNIWQLWKYKSDDKRFPSQCHEHIQRWRKVNTAYNHNLISFADAERKIEDYFSYDMPEIVVAYKMLPDDRLKYEFLKYLTVYTGGGLYADVDTLNAKPLKFWHKSNLKAGRLVVGINIDYNDINWDILYNRRMTFSNKIFMAKAHHPFLAHLIARITYTILNQKDEIAKINWNKSFQNIDSNEEPLIQLTGESIFTDTLFDYFNLLNNPLVHRIARTEKDLVPEQIFGPETDDLFSYRLFTMSKGPTQVDDVLVMPQVTFKGPLKGHHRGDSTDSYDSEYDDENDKNEWYYARPLHFFSWDGVANGVLF